MGIQDMPNAWDEAYEEGRTPWDMDEPQPELVKFAKKLPPCKALDLGCGTGSNAIFLAQNGFDVTGVDLSNVAIKKAKAKAKKAGGATRDAKGWRVKFVQGSVLDLHFLGQRFDLITDVGCFHSLGKGERERYAESLADALENSGTCFLMCFGEKEPNWGGPNRITKEELHETFDKFFEIEALRDATYKTKGISEHFKGVSDNHMAYLCVMKRK